MLASDSNSKIVYANLDSPMGEMIAGATARGVCFLEWSDRGGATRIIDKANNAYLQTLREELGAYFKNSLSVFTVPIDVDGTPFQKLIWNQLLEIPAGETRSYLQLARAVGKAGASRAVGRANGSNPLAIVIPCHRVIESSGGLGGYAGQIWRKKKLLELEGSLAPNLFQNVA